MVKVQRVQGISPQYRKHSVRVLRKLVVASLGRMCEYGASWQRRLLFIKLYRVEYRFEGIF